MKRIELSDKQKEAAIKILKKYKTFSSFSRKTTDAYKFTGIIGVNVCPYCNIEYVYTVYTEKKKPVIRPDIDHFIPKNKKTGNPKLQLELTNLVPACLVCNERLKRDLPFSDKTHINPYKEDFDSIMRFAINLNDTNYLNEDNFEIAFEARVNAKTDDVMRARENIKVFKLKERYQYHKNEVVMLFKRMKIYNKTKMEEIEQLITGKNFNSEKLNLLFPEKYCDINNTSLGKMKKDIIENLL